MAKCKYPNEICTNMTMLNSVAYCDSVPCSLKDEVPKQTNADRIRSMSDGELADFLYDCNFSCEYGCPARVGGCCEDCIRSIEEWLKKEVEDE